MMTIHKKQTATFISLFATVFFHMFCETVAFVFSSNWKGNDRSKRSVDYDRRTPLHTATTTTTTSTSTATTTCSAISTSFSLFLAKKQGDFGDSLEDDYARKGFKTTREYGKSNVKSELGFEQILIEQEDKELVYNQDGDYDYLNEYDGKSKKYQEYDEDFVMDPTTSKKRRRRRRKQMEAPTRGTQDIYNDDYYDEVDVGDEDESYTGNFWTNPVGGMDFRERQTKNKQRSSTTTQRPLFAPKTFVNDAKKPQRKTFRSGNPPPPNIIKEFYDRLFWYGFDPDETTSAADRTMFGGTRGKFDGLGLLQDIDQMTQEQQKSSLQARDKVVRGKRNRLSSTIKGRSRPKDNSANVYDRRTGNGSYDYDDDDYDDYEWYENFEVDEDEDEWYDDEDEDDGNNMDRDNGYDVYEDNFVMPTNRKDIPRQKKLFKVKEEFDAYDIDYDLEDESMTRFSRKSRRLDVSQWFEEEEEEEYVADADADVDVSPKDGAKMSPIVNILDSVFQIDADRVKYQAEDYNRRLGLDRKARFKSSYSTTSTTGGNYDIHTRRRRKGYAYRYVDSADNSREESDDSTFALNNTKENNVIDVDATVQVDSSTRQTEQLDKGRKQKEQSWEDRAAAYERVPPKGIIAWGPDGEMEGGIDARTYAAKMAMEEIFHARSVFEKKEAVVSEAEKELLQLKKEASIQKKLLLSMEDRRQLSIVRDRLRMINFDMEDAARQLRRAKAEALAAIDKLESIEFRHWALLRQYEADQELEKQRLQLPNNNE
jgi:hypothetical protein